MLALLRTCRADSVVAPSIAQGSQLVFLLRVGPQVLQRKSCAFCTAHADATL